MKSSRSRHLEIVYKMYMGLRPAYLELFKATTHAQDRVASMRS